MHRFICAVLMAVLAAGPLAACSTAARTSNAAGLDDSITALAGGGVAVTADVTSDVPLAALNGTPSAMRFTEWQVRNLVAEANANNGYLGSELDAFVSPPAGVPALTAIVGAWLTRGHGEDCPRLVPAGPLGATINVERADVSKVLDSLLQLVTNKLPQKLQSLLQPYEQPAMDAAKQAIGNFKGPHASATAEVMEYVADPLCSHTPPPAGATPPPGLNAGGVSQLPLVPCESLLAPVNVAHGYPGAVQLNQYMLPQTREFYRNMILSILHFAQQVNVPTQGLEGQPRIAYQTACAIGPPYTPPTDPRDDRPPVVALFASLPPDGQPVIAANSTPACVDALGADLTTFKAECQVINTHTTSGVSTGQLIFVFSATAEYVAETVGGGNGMILMRDVLDNLGRVPPPTPTPTAASATIPP